MSRLEIEAVDRPELVPALTEALFDLRIQIVRFQTRVVGMRVCAELFVVEFDGAAIRPSRRAEVQSAVLDIVERCTALAHAAKKRPAQRVRANFEGGHP